MKKIVGIVVVLAIILVVAIVAVTFSLGSIVKKGVELVGPRVAKVEVKLDSAKLSAFSGDGTLKGLLVGNPPGFNSPSAIKVEEISVGVQPSSLFSDKVVVRSVSVIAPEVTLHGIKGDNLTKILDNLQASAGGTGAAGAGDKKAAGPGKKIEVDDLLIKSGKVTLVLPMVGTATVALPDIHLTGLGKDTGGLAAWELSAQVIKAIRDSAISVATGAAKDPTKLLDGGAKDAGKQVDKLLKGAGGLLK
jgi:uncharacterized protein involved in outer membrane biogenesis